MLVAGNVSKNKKAKRIKQRRSTRRYSLNKLRDSGVFTPDTLVVKPRASYNQRNREEIGYQEGGHGCIKFIEDFCYFKIFPIGESIPKWVSVLDLPDTPHPVTGRSYKDIWEYEKTVLEDALQMDDHNTFIYRVIVLCWMRGEGKCQAKGSKVLMYDGTLKKVEDVRVGDLLMGDDSTPRTVLSLASGKEELFKVTPYRGAAKTFTKDHILSLKNSQGNVVDISINDYLQQSKSFKRSHFLYHTAVDFADKDVSVDPYFLGVRMKEYSLINNKHIPHAYKCNSREKRLQLLAGIIDADGYLNRNSFQIAQKSKTLTDDIAFLARSLGFFVNVSKCVKGIKETGFTGEYYTIGISGDCSVIPCRVKRKQASVRRHKKNVLTTGIKEIISAGVQEYYGFELDGNHRYVLEDFTVTHNSFLACLIQLWKFVCFPDQQIVLGANSKDQSKFVHFDILQDIIRNSPRLLKLVGEKNLQQKEIKLTDKKGDTISAIKSISSFSGIVSNITGYTFSEIFDMRNPKFFTQLDGSTRNVPNALGVIDSTVSEKTHILYKLYRAFVEGKDPSLFFSYRSSPKADYKDFFHPYMTQAQLNSYKTKFLPADYSRYFKNTWESAENTIFSEAVLSCTKYIGYEGQLGMFQKLHRIAKDLIKVRENPSMRDIPDFKDLDAQAARRMPISEIYTFRDERGLPKMMELQELEKLSDIYDTDFVLGVGIDRADPLKDELTKGARTQIFATLKGLPGSRSNPKVYMNDDAVKPYIYFNAGVWNVPDNSLNGIKTVLDMIEAELISIESVCGERWGLWDLVDWCDDHEVEFLAVQANYDLQKTGFTELYSLLTEGRYKTPSVPVPGIKSDDVFEEEALAFVHDSKNKFYGSVTKHENLGIQDDAMFALNWGIYGMRLMGMDHFVKRRFHGFMGTYIEDKTNRRIMHGRY